MPSNSNDRKIVCIGFFLNFWTRVITALGSVGTARETVWITPERQFGGSPSRSRILNLFVRTRRSFSVSSEEKERKAESFWSSLGVWYTPDCFREKNSPKTVYNNQNRTSKAIFYNLIGSAGLSMCVRVGGF